jgi:hypothetical protein
MLISFDKSSIQACCVHDVLVRVSLDKLTLDLVEALAASELLKKVHLIRRVIPTSVTGTISLAFATDLTRHTTALQAFPSTFSAFSINHLLYS